MGVGRKVRYPLIFWMEIYWLVLVPALYVYSVPVFVMKHNVNQSDSKSVQVIDPGFGIFLIFSLFLCIVECYCMLLDWYCIARYILLANNDEKGTNE